MDFNCFYSFFNVSRPLCTQRAPVHAIVLTINGIEHVACGNWKGSSHYWVHSLYKGHLSIVDNLAWSHDVRNSEVLLYIPYADESALVNANYSSTIIRQLLVWLIKVVDKDLIGGEWNVLVCCGTILMGISKRGDSITLLKNKSFGGLQNLPIAIYSD